MAKHKRGEMRIETFEATVIRLRTAIHAKTQTVTVRHTNTLLPKYKETSFNVHKVQPSVV